MHLNNYRSLVHVKRKCNDGTVASSLNCRTGSRVVIDTFITRAAINVCSREMLSSDVCQFSSGRNLPH
eukprot:4801086-Heterocapsa_arctica.AAC.1